MLVDTADARQPLAAAEDLIQNLPLTALPRPVCFRKKGEDCVPYNLPDALRLVETKGVGTFTRCPIEVDDIEPLLLTDSRLPSDSQIIARYRSNHQATLSALLCYYVRHGRVVGARRMVALGAEVNAHEEADGGTALHVALGYGHRLIAEWLVETCKAEVVGARNRAGATPFLMAVAANDMMAVRYLRTWVLQKHGAAWLNRMIHETDSDGASAFVIAMRRDLHAMMAVLDREVGAPVDAFEIKRMQAGGCEAATPTGMMSLSPVILAIEMVKPPSYLRLLVTAGADLAAARKGRLNAMAVAAACNSVPHICMLRRLGLPPDAEAFRQAALHNRPRALRFLAAPSPTPSARPDHYRPHTNGDDSSVSDNDLGDGIPPTCSSIPPSLGGAGALAAAVTHDAYQAAEALCSMGAETATALLAAVRGDRVWAVRLLLSTKSATPTRRWPRWADTPLTLAVSLEREEIVLLMAAAGLPPGMLNARRGHDGRTALDLAEALLPACFDALREAGALTSAMLRAGRKRRAGRMEAKAESDEEEGDSDGANRDAAAAAGDDTASESAVSKARSIRDDN